MTDREGFNMPASYGDVHSEYAAVRDAGAGLIDLSSRGRILVAGSEAVPFLNGLITNDMKTLQPNTWMPAAFPNVQGRLIASVRVIRVDDAANNTPRVLLDTEPATHESVLKTIERFTLAGDFHVTDISNETSQLSLQGKRATELVRTVLGDNVSTLPVYGAIVEKWGDADVTVARSSHTGEDGFDMILNSEQSSMLWESLLAAGARPVGYDALEILRIEAGIPRYGVDMDETNVVTETALDDAVSYTKGCYVGQEIIARIKYRGHVAKQLTGLLFDEQISIVAGAGVKTPDGKDIGLVTSVTHSPRLNQTIALGYLKYDYLSPGTAVKIETSNGAANATVTAIPFVKNFGEVSKQGGSRG